ncbi:hypothetical protein HT031_006529 [Scenedesmus sp. PABB004]|nr:hypothetical protein HT031_006529 [Scenedesmus sp. PABB004]
MGDPPALAGAVERALAERLAAARAREQAQADALLASQKHLTSHLRSLINSLDTILALSTPRLSAAQPEALRSVAARAKALQKQLGGVAARLQRIQAHLQPEQPRRSSGSSASSGERSPLVEAPDRRELPAGGPKPLEQPAEPPDRQQEQQQQRQLEECPPTERRSGHQQQQQQQQQDPDG